MGNMAQKGEPPRGRVAGHRMACRADGSAGKGGQPTGKGKAGGGHQPALRSWASRSMPVKREPIPRSTMVSRG